MVLFFIILLTTLLSGKICPADPWETLQDDNTSPTLEWMVESPPAFHTFEEVPRLFVSDAK